MGLTKTQQKVCMDVAHALKHQCPDIDPQYIFRACFGAASGTRGALTSEGLTQRVLRFISAKRTRASRYTLPLQPPESLVRLTVPLRLDGQTIPAQVSITSNEWRIICGRLNLPDGQAVSFFWDAQKMPTAEEAQFDQIVQSMALALAREACTAGSPAPLSNRPYVQRPTEIAQARVINEELADPLQLECLQAEVRLWNKAWALRENAPQPALPKLQLEMTTGHGTMPAKQENGAHLPRIG